MLLYVICTVGSLFSIVSTTEFAQCKSGASAPTIMTISNCDKPPCPMKKGTSPTFQMEFVAGTHYSTSTNDDYTEIVLGLTATYMGMTKGYPGIDGKPHCNNIYSMPDNVKVGCPIEKGKMYRHEFTLPLKLPMPQTTVPARYFLKDKKTKKEIVCTEISLALQ